MSKRIITLLLVITIVSSLFAGCTKGNDSKQESTNTTTASQTGEATTTAADTSSQYGDTGGLKLPIVDSPLTLEAVVVSEYSKLSDLFVAKELEKRTGITLKIQEIPSANFPDKVKMIYASGKLPDIMVGNDFNDINKLALQGAFEPINPYIDQLPNFKALFANSKDHSWVLKSYSASDDNLYWFPEIYTMRKVNHGFLYRKDVFDKNGIKPWTNTEEFYQALKKLKEIYPNSVPFSSKTQTDIFRDFAYGWGLRVDIVTSNCYYDESNKLWKFGPVQPEYKDMLDFMKKLYNEKLLDPEFLTDTEASWGAKMVEGEKTFATFDWVGRLDLFYNQIKETIPEYNLRYANPIGPVGKIRRLDDVYPEGPCIPKNPHSLEAMKLIDYLYSPSGATLTTMGVEGVTFVRDVSGKITYPELKDKPSVDISTLSEKYGMFTVPLWLRADPRCVYFNLTEKVQEATDMMVKNDKIEVSDPLLKYITGEQEVINTYSSTLIKAALEFSSKYVIDKSYTDVNWNDWVKNAEKLGCKKLEEAYNAAQKRYDGN